MVKVVLYETDNGKCPVGDFLDSLPSKHAQKVLWVLKTIQEIETVPTVYLKKLVSTDGIWEVRASVGNATYRILGFFEKGKFLLLNHGFVKKTQKTPRKEINVAEKRMQEYLNRRRKKS